MVILKLCGLLLWLLLLPFSIGMMGNRFLQEDDRSAGATLLVGYLMQFALFELIGIPVVILTVYKGFTTLSMIYLCVLIACALLGMVITLREKRDESLENGKTHGFVAWMKDLPLLDKILCLVFFAFLGFQLYMAFTRASFDGDDTYYNVVGLIAQQQNTLYRINPYTGRSAPLDERHAMALMPIWEAFVSKMSGIHMTVMAHTVLPFILIPLSYLLYFQIGKKLFRGKEERVPMFMVLMAAFQMFGNVSIQTTETFFLTRTWQGKSVCGNLILPAVFWIYLCILENEGESKRKKGYFILLAILNLAAGISSSLAVLLTSALTFGMGVLSGIRKKSLLLMIFAGLSVIPGAVYILIYLIIS